MDANTVFLILQLLLFLLFVAVIIVGDVYLTYMVFNSSSYTCENFDNPTTTQKPVKETPSTTAAKPIHSPCYNLSTAQLGFARFMNIVFWILFAVVTLGSIYMLYSYLGDNEVLFIFAIAILITMSVFILVGGIFLTQYVFNGDSKNCYMPIPTVTGTATTKPASTTSQYCYDMSDTKLTFAKIAVVFNWLYSIVTILTLGAFIYQANLA